MIALTITKWRAYSGLSNRHGIITVVFMETIPKEGERGLEIWRFPIIGSEGRG